MDNIEQIIADMPRAKNPHKCWCAEDKCVLFRLTTRQRNEDMAYHRHIITAKAQCRLLAEKGYRKVPSEEEIRLYLESEHLVTVIRLVMPLGVFVKRFHKWLMGKQDA